MDSESEITVNVLAVDTKKGLLDVEVTEKYTQLDGSTGNASYRKTVILDTVSAEAPKHHKVTFMVESGYASGIFEKYKEFTISHGSNVIFPGAVPTMDGYSFKHWSPFPPSAENRLPEASASTVTVESELTFYAVFEANN